MKKLFLILLSIAALSCYVDYVMDLSSKTVKDIPEYSDSRSVVPDREMPVMSTFAQDNYVVTSIPETGKKEPKTNAKVSVVKNRRGRKKKGSYMLKMSEIKSPPFIKDYRNPCWYYNDTLTCYPFFFIAGFSKCGTTDLTSRVGSHPLVILKARKSMVKYLNIKIYTGEGVDCTGDVHCGTAYYASKGFQHPSKVIALSDDYRKMNDHLQHLDGASEESKQFATETAKHVEFLQKFPKETAAILKKGQKHFKYPLITVEATSYVAENNHKWKEIAENQGLSAPRYATADWIQRVNPDARIIFTLRDPVERVFSHYVYIGAKQNRRISPELFHKHVQLSVNWMNKCLQKGTPPAVCTAAPRHAGIALEIGMYAVHLRNWLDRFPRKHFFFSKFEDYRQNTSHVLAQIYKFLELPPVSKKAMEFIAGVDIDNMTEAKKSMEMLPETRKLLTKFYKPHVKEVAKLLDDDRFLWHYGQA